MSKNKSEVEKERLRKYVAKNPDKSKEIGETLASLDKNKTPDLSKEFSSLSQIIYSGINSGYLAVAIAFIILCIIVVGTVLLVYLYLYPRLGL